jgi:hypothetical protein
MGTIHVANLNLLPLAQSPLRPHRPRSFPGFVNSGDPIPGGLIDFHADLVNAPHTLVMSLRENGHLGTTLKKFLHHGFAVIPQVTRQSTSCGSQGLLGTISRSST